MAKRKKNTNLRLDAQHRPLFAPVHSAHMTEKDRPRNKDYKNFSEDWEDDEFDEDDSYEEYY